MSVVFDEAAESILTRPRHRVAIRRDGDEYVVVLLPEEEIALRNRDVSALQKACRFLRWEIVSDVSVPTVGA